MPTLNEIGLKYFFTKYGDVYSGFGFDEMHLPNYKVIIQSDKLLKYNSLPTSERTVEKIAEYGWLVPKSLIVGEMAGENLIRPRNFDNGTYFSDRIRKDLFIFGAGASAHCVVSDNLEHFSRDSLRPPLGNELFAYRFREFYKRYEGVRQSLSDLQEKGINVEEYLEDEWKEIEHGNDIVMSRHINIQFYLQEILMQMSHRIAEEYFEGNLFAKFARKLQVINGRSPKRHFAIVSFNQDTILENFITQQFKRPIISLDDYAEVNERPFCIFKPHGSWNWGWRFPKKIRDVQAQLFNANINYHQLYYEILGNLTDMLDWNSFGKETFSHDHGIGRFTIDKSRLQLFNSKNIGEYYPALLLPYRDKDELTMPLKHYHCLTSYLNYVENIYIIGWKGNEKVFNKLLWTHAHQLRRVIIVDPNPNIVEANLTKVLSKKGIELAYYSGFEEFVGLGLEDELTI